MTGALCMISLIRLQNPVRVNGLTAGCVCELSELSLRSQIT